jgi:hypothetical protein
MWAAVAQHALSFGVGVLVGLLAASRYRIVRVRNGKEGTDAS